MKSVNDFVRNILKNAVSSELCNTVDIHYNYYYKAVVQVNLILARHSWAVCTSAKSSLSLSLSLCSGSSLPVRQLPPVVKALDEDSRGGFPLSLVHSPFYAKSRIALVG